MRAVDWLKSQVPSSDMTQRLDAARTRFEAARLAWAAGEVADVYDPSDAAAWYVLQGETFATDRRYWVPHDCVRTVPFLTRLGKELALLRKIPGADDRAARMMGPGRSQPDSGLFELLVALAYARRGWSRVEFVPEQPGVRRTHDLNVFKRGSRWAVECKRLGLPTYTRRERDRGRALAAPVHDLSVARGMSLVVEVIYLRELQAVPDDYLSNVVAAAIDGRRPKVWKDALSIGRVREVDWSLPRRVLRHDDVYYGSSRMIELLVGHYDHDAEHSMTAKWRPASKRPSYAEAVYQASVVSWRSQSKEAIARKARHFRSVLANAEDQLPDDRPGVIHIGVESGGGPQIDVRRHIQNFLEARVFTIQKSRLRWVYTNYFVPEVTTRQDETWAITETVAPYKVGSHSTKDPLPRHMLLSPEDEGRSGAHWDSLAHGFE